MPSSLDDLWYCMNCSFPFNFADSFFEEPTEHTTEVDLQASPSTGRVNAGIHNNFPNGLVLKARSIQNKISYLHSLLVTDSFHIVAMTETWLDQNYLDCELQLEGYNVYQKDTCRSNRRGGGVLIAVRDHITCTHRTDLEVEAEMIALEIHPNPTMCVLFCVFYKPPGIDEYILGTF